MSTLAPRSVHPQLPVRRSGTPGPWARGWWRRPSAVLVGASVMAWVALGILVFLLGWPGVHDGAPSTAADAAPAGTGEALATGTQHSAHHHPAAAAGEPVPAAGTGWDGWGNWSVMWVLMVLAMMWPLWSRTVDRAWRATFPAWRIAGLAVFLAAVTGLWLAVGAAARSLFLAVPSSVAWVWPLAWIAVALVSLGSVARQQLLRRCQPLQVVAPRGRRAVVTAARLGWRSWPRCAVLCGPVMVAMVGAHQPLLMVGGSLAVWWEQRYPRRHRDRVPAVLLGATAVGVLVLGATGTAHG